MLTPENLYSSAHPLHEIMKVLLARPTPPLLPEAPWDSSLTTAIDNAADAPNASVYIRASLHLLNDDLDRAHGLVQQHEGNQTADYLHMLVHRREGDWSNTGYWVRRTGPHPIYATLAATIRQETGDTAIQKILSPWEHWEPMAMLELCRQAEREKPDREAAAAVAWLSVLETSGALDWCIKNAA